MKLSKQLYSNIDGLIELNYRPEFGTALNLTGYLWVDGERSFLKPLLVSKYKRHPLLVTDTDLLAHDDYMQSILPGAHEIVMVNCSTSGRKKSGSYRIGKSLPFNGQETCGASTKRLKQAAAKLRAAGFSVKYFADHDAALRYIDKQTPESIAKRLAKRSKKQEETFNQLRLVNS